MAAFNKFLFSDSLDNFNSYSKFSKPHPKKNIAYYRWIEYFTNVTIEVK